MKEKTEEILEQARREIKEADSLGRLGEVKVKYLGRKSVINELFKAVSGMSAEEKAVFGQGVNALKEKISALVDSAGQKFQDKEEAVDLTFPAKYPGRGSIHLLSYVSARICSVFEKLGFIIHEGGEVEDEWHNFTALNIPIDHPSRDGFDTFYLNVKERDKGKFLLRSHTSPSQIRVMAEKKPPLAVISPGRVYRPDKVDATHSFMFHQIEGFCVDTGVSFANLKGVLLCFARDFFSAEAELRFRPHFFPFTEPSAEVDVSCIVCGRNRVKRSLENRKRCSLCKGKGWLEILGCGMIHPKVLKACGIDSKKYRGFAFGMGVDRIAMLKYGIDDIRLFYENDERFLKQFYV